MLDKKPPKIPPNIGRILGDIHLAGQDFLGGVLFLCKKTFHIFLCLNQLLDLIPCFALVDLFEFEVIVTPKLGVASSHGVGGFQQVVAEIAVHASKR